MKVVWAMAVPLLTLLLSQPQPVSAAEPSPSLTSAPLYLHCIGPKGDHSCVRLLSVRIYLGQDIEVFLHGNSTPALSGKVEMRDGRLFANLHGDFGNSGTFEGSIGLDRRFAPPGYGFSGYVSPFKFVVSNSTDLKQILAEPFYDVVK